MAMSGVNSDHLQREEQGPHHAKLRIMTSNISQETGECHTTLRQAFIWSQTPPPLLTGSKLEVTFSKQTVNAVHQMVLEVETWTAFHCLTQCRPPSMN